jgi:hypothetical protein
MNRPFEAYRGGALAKVNLVYQRYLAQGFATADFEGQPEPETLQCRDELDRTNWIGLLLKCQAAISQGAGALPIDPPIRCTSNRMYAVTYNDATARMYALLNQVGAAQANWWRLKDLVRACGQREDLALIDVDEGWP